MTIEATAPIVLFVYNRPLHTQRTLEKLEQNLLSNTSELFIFSDGAKTEKNEDAVREVREVISRDWKFKKVTISIREKNWGLAKNVIDGVSSVIKKFGTAIVLEDDVLLTPHSLVYFNEGLQKYKHEEKVMHIGAYMYNVNRSQLDETFFTRMTMSQAWATWERSWQYFEPDINLIIEQFDEQKIKDFTFDHTMNFWRQINQQRDGKVDSWAVRWYASVFLKGGLSLQTAYSLLENIGHDGTGVHSSISNMFDTEIQDSKINYFPDVIEENPKGFFALKQYFKHRKGSLIDRGIRFIKNKLFAANS